MNVRRPEPVVMAGIVVGVGIALGGFLAGRGFAAGRVPERYVSVKGIAERQARADLAFWPLRLVVADNDLGSAHARLRSQVAQVRAFLARHRLDSSQIELQSFSVSDAATNQFRDGGVVANRFVIRQVVMVRSTQPDLVLAASQQVGELVAAGIPLTSGEEYGSGGPTFVFSGLNDLKPAMIAEATARARESAEQFARDSRSTLGGIRRAWQGVFEILPGVQAPGVDEGTQIVKTVRVVSTVDFTLKD